MTFAMQKKFVVYGILIGILIGYCLQIFFPKILLTELYMNLKMFENLKNASGVKGSLLAVGNLLPMIFAFIGGFLGKLFFKFLHMSHNID
jgi:hypothetical protein